MGAKYTCTALVVGFAGASESWCRDFDTLYNRLKLIM